MIDRRAMVFLIALVLLAAAPAAAQQPGPQGREHGVYREQEWRVPVADADGRTTQLLEALVYRPPGEVLRPLVIVSHGTPRRPADRLRMRPDWAERTAALFVSEGYAVIVPMRRGYGRSPGDADDRTPGGCADPDYADVARRGARQILEVAAFMRQQGFVDANKIVLAGQSAGGLASLAVAATNPSGVVGVVNFAGGRGSRAANDVCREDRLVAAMGSFGASTRIPSIWLYAENDLFFRPELARRMHTAYATAGIRTALHILPSYGNDGHGFVRRADSAPVWQPLVRDFLATLRTGAKPTGISPDPDSERESSTGTNR